MYFHASTKGLRACGTGFVLGQARGQVYRDGFFDQNAQLLAIAADPQVKGELKTRTQAAVDRGIFGAPTFFVGDEMFWGQDRLNFVRDALLA